MEMDIAIPAEDNTGASEWNLAVYEFAFRRLESKTESLRQRSIRFWSERDDM